MAIQYVLLQTINDDTTGTNVQMIWSITNKKLFKIDNTNNITTIFDFYDSNQTISLTDSITEYMIYHGSISRDEITKYLRYVCLFVVDDTSFIYDFNTNTINIVRIHGDTVNIGSGALKEVVDMSNFTVDNFISDFASSNDILLQICKDLITETKNISN